MRANPTFIAIGLLILSSGCALMKDSVGVTTHQVRRSVNNWVEKTRNHRLATRAWKKARKQNPDLLFSSSDYVDGYKDGFADLLYYGDTCEPPVLPPSRYRTVHYQNPKGYQAIQKWFCGYKHGMEDARLSDYRKWIVGPSNVPSPEIPMEFAEPIPEVYLPEEVNYIAPVPMPLQQKNPSSGEMPEPLLMPPKIEVKDSPVVIQMGHPQELAPVRAPRLGPPTNFQMDP